MDTRKWSWPKSCDDEVSAPRQVRDGSRSPLGEARRAFSSREAKALNSPDARGAGRPTAFTPPRSSSPISAETKRSRLPSKGLAGREFAAHFSQRCPLVCGRDITLAQGSDRRGTEKCLGDPGVGALGRPAPR